MGSIQMMTVEQVMEEMNYKNKLSVYCTLTFVRKRSPNVAIRNGRKLLINPMLMPKTTLAERNSMEQTYWKLEEKIGEIEICHRVGKLLNQSYISVHNYFKSFTFTKRCTFEKYYKALLQVAKDERVL